MVASRIARWLSLIGIFLFGLCSCFRSAPDTPDGLVWTLSRSSDHLAGPALDIHYRYDSPAG